MHALTQQCIRTKEKEPITEGRLLHEAIPMAVLNRKDIEVESQSEGISRIRKWSPVGRMLLSEGSEYS